MGDSQLYAREPKSFELPYPIEWTFAQSIPRVAVDLYIRRHPELRLDELPSEEAAYDVAMIYFKANQNEISACASPREREEYYLEQQTRANAIEKEKPLKIDVNADVETARAHYYRRKDELTSAMAGPMTQADALVIEQHAKTLIAVDRLLCIDERKKSQNELGEFLRNSAREHLQESENKEEEYREFVRNNVQKYIARTRE